MKNVILIFLGIILLCCGNLFSTILGIVSLFVAVNGPYLILNYSQYFKLPRRDGESQ